LGPYFVDESVRLDFILAIRAKDRCLPRGGVPMVLDLGTPIDSTGSGQMGYSSYAWSALTSDDLKSGSNSTGGGTGSGANLLGYNYVNSFYSPLVTTPCILTMGGVNAVTWNIWDYSKIVSTNGELNFYQEGLPRYPPNANQFGTNDSVWSEFSYETDASGGGNFELGEYTYPEPYTPLLRAAEGGTGVAPSGTYDIMWIVTNDGDLFSFNMPD
jgi:hypothetical protein